MERREIGPPCPHCGERAKDTGLFALDQGVQVSLADRPGVWRLCNLSGRSRMAVREETWEVAALGPTQEWEWATRSERAGRIPA